MWALKLCIALAVLSSFQMFNVLSIVAKANNNASKLSSQVISISVFFFKGFSVAIKTTVAQGKSESV